VNGTERLVLASPAPSSSSDLLDMPGLAGDACGVGAVTITETLGGESKDDDPALGFISGVPGLLSTKRMPVAKKSCI
jgi:hypothetical protein